MPYRPTDDGRIVAVRADNRPRRGMACPPAGCGPARATRGASGTYRRGVGADAPVSQAAPAAPEGLSRADAVVLAAGARIGDRAARYAIQVVRTRGLGDYPNTWEYDYDRGQYYYTSPDTGVKVFLGRGVDPSGTPASMRGAATGSSDSSSAGGIWTTLFGAPQPGQGIVGSIAPQAIGAYNLFSGKGPATPTPAPASAGPSSGTILLVLGTVAILGIGVAVAMSMSRRAPVKANRRAAHRTSRKNRYFVQRRAA